MHIVCSKELSLFSSVFSSSVSLLVEVRRMRMHGKQATLESDWLKCINNNNNNTRATTTQNKKERARE